MKKIFLLVLSVLALSTMAFADTEATATACVAGADAAYAEVIATVEAQLTADSSPAALVIATETAIAAETAQALYVGTCDTMASFTQTFTETPTITITATRTTTSTITTTATPTVTMTTTPFMSKWTYLQPVPQSGKADFSGFVRTGVGVSWNLLTIDSIANTAIPIAIYNDTILWRTIDVRTTPLVIDMKKLITRRIVVDYGTNTGTGTVDFTRP